MYQDKDEIQTSRTRILKTFGNSPDLVFMQAWAAEEADTYTKQENLLWLFGIRIRRFLCESWQS